MTSRKDLMNEAYDALLISAGVVAFSMLSKKLFKEKLVCVDNVKDFVRLSVAVIASTLLVKYAQDKKWVPTDPVKTV